MRNQYLAKTAFGKELIAPVHSVVAGEVVLSPSVAPRLLKRIASRATKPLPLDAGEKLSVRELEILGMASRGMSNKDIALGPKLSLRTVKGYLAETFSKLMVGSRTEAVVTAA